VRASHLYEALRGKWVVSTTGDRQSARGGVTDFLGDDCIFLSLRQHVTVVEGPEPLHA
jgi:hypothetical protein